MSLGTLYVADKARGFAPKALTNYLKLDVKISERDDTHKKNFPLGTIPTFIGQKGFKLQEVIAVLIHLVKLSETETKLLGKNELEYVQILQWLSISNSELIPSLATTFQPLIGAAPFNKKQVDEGHARIAKVAELYEKRLANYTYLVGERVTLADVFGATAFYRGFEHLFGDEWRKEHPNTTRWFKTLIEGEILKDVVGGLKFRAKPVEFVPPKKEKKQAQPQAKKEAAPKKEGEAAEAAPAADKKPKHPLEPLGKPKASLDEWKRLYSNEETRDVAIPYFWNTQYDPEEWSLWKVDYKYNDELTLVFMSNNLIGGFFARLGASTKYLFGSMVVYGENSNNGITGFFLVRGQDHAPAFDVAPDWESYSFTKLDASNEENKKFINNMLAWDEPVVVNGEKREIADGKVFK